MLYLNSLVPSTPYTLIADGYVFGARWSIPFPKDKLYWMTGNSRRSHFEFGVDAATGQTLSFTLVIVEAVGKLPEQYPGLETMCSSCTIGLPVFELKHWPTSVDFWEEPGPLKLYVGQDRLSIWFGEAITQPRSCVCAENVSFGLDALNRLVAIDVNGIPEGDMKSVLLAFGRHIKE